MVPEGPVPYSQEPAIYPYSEPEESNPNPLILSESQAVSSLGGFPTNIL